MQIEIPDDPNLMVAAQADSSAKPQTTLGDAPSEKRSSQKQELTAIRADDAMAAEINWLVKILSHLLPQAARQLEKEFVCRAISEAMMSAGLAVCEPAAEGNLLRAAADYERSAAVVVLLFAVLEAAIEGISRGLGPDESLNRALESKHWRPLEPTPADLRPLVRKLQRAFPHPFVRRMHRDLFWYVAMPRIVEEGLAMQVLE